MRTSIGTPSDGLAIFEGRADGGLIRRETLRRLSDDSMAIEVELGSEGDALELVHVVELQLSSAPTIAPTVMTWGGMREVLREGRTEGRVELVDVLGPDTVAVGALAGLTAEITIEGGRAQLAEVVDEGGERGLRVRDPVAGDRATLLLLSNVPTWSEHELPAASDLAALERSVAAVASEQGIDVSEPFPFRVEGRALNLGLHVLDGSCPIANPQGPAPWRWNGADEAVRLVGFHAANSAGRLTHHGQSSHTHAVLPRLGVSGHLDEVRLAAGARLFLPGR